MNDKLVTRHGLVMRRSMRVVSGASRTWPLVSHQAPRTRRPCTCAPASLAHKDLESLRSIAECAPYFGITDTTRALIDRLIAAAEADAPLLREGWVKFADHNVGNETVYYSNGDGTVSRVRLAGGARPAQPLSDFGSGEWVMLRPTVTQDDLHHITNDCSCEPADLWDHLAELGIEVRES